MRLQAQPARVLSCLIQRAGEVISREELRGTVWGAETFVDFERGLNFCIAQIRAALDDDSVSPRYIRTVPRRGYQFIAPVQLLGEPLGTESHVAARRLSRSPVIWTIASVALLTALVAGYWLRVRARAKQIPVIAVLRFDNETGDAGLTPFCDGLTDSVVEQLTTLSRQRYEVIGNASILRVPREQRDLIAISSSLHAGYVVLGQIQTSGSQTRILAHLIRLPDQKHLRVERMDRSVTDPLAVELETSRDIAEKFSDRMLNDAAKSR